MASSWISFTWLSHFSLPAALLLLVLLPLPLLLIWKKSTKQKPPGPTGWPVVGNLFDLGTMPHQTLYKLKFKYGPVLWLKLGSVNTMVIQSPKAAAEFFKNHDSTFWERRVSLALTSCNYNQGSMGVGNNPAHWRLLRKLCTSELLANKRLNDTSASREKCVDKMTQWIEEDSLRSRACGGSGEVELSCFLFIMTFNIMGNLMLSRDLLEPHSEEGRGLFNAVNKISEFNKPCAADFLPFLKWMGRMGTKSNMDPYMGQAMKIVAEYVSERVQRKKNSSTHDKVNTDFLDVTLEYEGDGEEGPNKLSESNVTTIILEMFFAGSESTGSTIEWAMAELLRSPNSMRKVKEELNSVVGLNGKVQEKNLEQLPYLEAVVKENFRLHPAGPLLIPRNAMHDSNYMGYHIPKNTQVFVNAWALGRDPESWDDPLSFKPERFLGNNIDYKGQHFELIPFGSGRRMCPGFALGHRVFQLALASLIHSFDWEVSSRAPEIMDMTERTGTVLRKLVPLKAIPRKRNPL